MAYPDRLAVRVTPDIAIVLAQVVIPAIPEDQYGDPNATWQNPPWYGGSSASASMGTNALFVDAYHTGDFVPSAIKVMAVGDHDHALYTAGTIAGGDSYNTLDLSCYFHDTFFGIQNLDEPDGDHVTYLTIKQPLGPPAGGASSSSLASTSSETVEIADSGGLGFLWGGPASGSSVSSPIALFGFINAGATVKVGALRCDGSQPMAVVGLFTVDDALWNEAVDIVAGWIVGAQHYFVIDIGKDEPGGEISLHLVETTEQAYPATTYDIHRIGFDDPDLPTYIKSDLWGTSGPEADFRTAKICGTELGFIVSYSEKIAGTWTPKFMLVSNDWTTFQRITITGDATTAAILAQATETTQTYAFHIGLTYGDGTYSLLGGTPASPLLAQSATTGCPLDLGDIVRDVARRSGMPMADIDTSDLDQCVEGYSWTQGAGKQILGPLLEIYDSEMRPNGYMLEGIKRGKPRDGLAIFSNWFARSGDEPRYTIKQDSESDLPRRIFMTFADIGAEQQPNTAVMQRDANSVRTARELSFDMTTLAMGADEAQQRIEIALRRQWIRALGVDAKLEPSRGLRLIPGIVRDLVLDGEVVRAKLTRMTIAANRLITTHWEQDRGAPYIGTIDTTNILDPEVLAAIAEALDGVADTPGTSSEDAIRQSPGAPATGIPSSQMYVPVDTTAFVLDIPLITDVHDQTTPLVYVAAGANDPLGDWPGAVISRSDSGLEGSYLSGWDSVLSSSGATHGTAGSPLPTALTSVMDEGSYLAVFLAHGTLVSVTQEELDASADLNLALIGNEIIQFRDAVLQSEGEWLLSGLVRGARGTEQHVDNHVEGERFLLFSNVVKRHDLGASEIGDTDWYQGTTFLLETSTQAPIELPFTAAAHKPYSPAHVTLTRDDVTGDWLIEWQRRSRIGGSALNGQDVPLGESSESYKVKIMEGMSGSDAVRTFTPTSESQLYTSAEQVSDWGSPQTTLAIEVCQVSPALSLDGFYTAAGA